jgi:hypothetical protein
MMVEFLKEKSEAAQEVINDLAHLITQGRTPKAIQIDQGKEFVNDKLKQWCKEKGIESFNHSILTIPKWHCRTNESNTCRTWTCYAERKGPT